MNLHPVSVDSVSCEVHRDHGPKGVHGCVTLKFERAEAFGFVSSVGWPDGENHDSVVEAAVQDALRQLQMPHQYVCRLTRIRWNDIDSCATGFELAARNATFAALGLGSNVRR